MNSKIIFYGNRGKSCVFTHNLEPPYFQWKVDITHIMFNSDKALVGVEKQDGS